MRFLVLAAPLVLVAAAPLAAQTTAPSMAPAPAVAPLPSVVLPPDLDRVLRDYESAWRAKDAAALAKLFAEDGFVLSTDTPPVRGRAAIEKQYAGSGGPLVLRGLAYATEESLGYVVGGFSRKEGEPDIGKFTLTLRRGKDGRWLIFSDMDNGNARRGPRPPGPGAPPVLPQPVSPASATGTPATSSS